MPTLHFKNWCHTTLHFKNWCHSTQSAKKRIGEECARMNLVASEASHWDNHNAKTNQQLSRPPSCFFPPLFPLQKTKSNARQEKQKKKY
jgi:hypothetical protein